MARQPSTYREIHKFIQTGKPSDLAAFFSQKPDAAISFLGLRSEQQLRRLNQLLESSSDSEVQTAVNRVDEALEKRESMIALFAPEEKPAAKKKPKAEKQKTEKPAVPKKGNAKAERNENLVMAAQSAGRVLLNLIPTPKLFKPYEAFRHSVRFLTESIAATLSAAGLNKTQRHIVELAAGIPAFAVLSVKAAAPLTGLAMSFSAMTGEAEAALPPMPEPIQQSLAMDAERFAPLQITVTRDGTETALGALNTNFQQANLGNIPHLSYSASGEIRYRGWHVSDNVANAALTSAEIVGIPPQFLFSMIGPESSFIADNFNEDTEACGLGQFIPSTLYEKVYNYGTLIGYPQIQNLVERYVARRDEQNRPFYGFKPKSEDAAAQIRTACMDPDFNTRLNSVYIARNIGHMQEALKPFTSRAHEYYPVDATQVYLAHFSGIGRALDMIEDMHTNNGQTIAHMYFNRVATDANLNYLFVNGDRNAPRTVAQFISFLKDDKKLGDSVMPDMRNWSERRDIIQANVRTASSDTNMRSSPPNPIN